MTMKPMKMTQAIVVCAAAVLVLASAANAAVIVTVSDTTPNGDNGTGTRALSTTLGTVSAPPAIPTTTYTVTGLDLTSVGGGASETIAFDITYSQTGGTGVQFNGFGNIAVTGGDNNQVDNLETITATVSLNGATTFTGGVSLGFIEFTTGGTSNPGTDEFWDIITASGTQSFQSPGNITSTFSPSSFVTLDPVAGDNRNGTFNVQGFVVEITAVPEPASLALLGLGGMLVVSRRRA